MSGKVLRVRPECSFPSGVMYPVGAFGSPKVPSAWVLRVRPGMSPGWGLRVRSFSSVEEHELCSRVRLTYGSSMQCSELPCSFRWNSAGSANNLHRIIHEFGVARLCVLWLSCRVSCGSRKWQEFTSSVNTMSTMNLPCSVHVCARVHFVSLSGSVGSTTLHLGGCGYE